MRVTAIGAGSIAVPNLAGTSRTAIERSEAALTQTRLALHRSNIRPSQNGLIAPHTQRAPRHMDRLERVDRLDDRARRGQQSAGRVEPDEHCRPRARRRQPVRQGGRCRRRSRSRRPPGDASLPRPGGPPRATCTLPRGRPPPFSFVAVLCDPASVSQWHASVVPSRGTKSAYGSVFGTEQLPAVDAGRVSVVPGEADAPGTDKLGVDDAQRLGR